MKHQETDVVIVGAGPIGLLNAWALKRINPKLHVTVLEKYAVYQRKHTLVMEYKKLQELMRITGTEQDPTLVALLTRLKKNNHIRTTELEDVFKKLAEESGVEILTKQEVKEETLQQQIFDEFPNAKLIIGADGTHSVVSKKLFPEGNQVKYEFDYVLQLRYEIEGEEKAEHIPATAFYQQMTRAGLIANEYVGPYDGGKTPVTLQMMISKEMHDQLQQATSKDPIYLFRDGAQHPATLPPEIKHFLTNYLDYKRSHTPQAIDRDTLRISVNEAPATYARQVTHKTTNNKRVLLVGDAQLGLSYFKGLNAGLESTAHLLTHMKPAILAGLSNPKQLASALTDYESWFLTQFAPKKIREVEQYSTWRIRAPMKVMQTAHHIKDSSYDVEMDDREPILRDYFNYVATDAFDDMGKKNRFKAFPHRKYEPVAIAELAYVPLQHTLLKTVKILTDFFKPYKSLFQLKQDYKQPLVGITHVGVGIIKFLKGCVTLNIKGSVDGALHLLRGAIEIATTPLNWVIKPITRGIATLLYGKPNIEDNKGLQRLAKDGIKRVTAGVSDARSWYEILAICNDMHRKFEKSERRGQKTQLTIKEHTHFHALRSNNEFNQTQAMSYFSLFKKSPQREGAINSDQHLWKKPI